MAKKQASERHQSNVGGEKPVTSTNDTVTPTDAPQGDDMVQMEQFEQEVRAFFRQEKADEIPVESLLQSIEHTYPSAPKQRQTSWWSWSVWGGLSLGMASLAALLLIPTLDVTRQSASRQLQPQQRSKAPARPHLITRGGGPVMYVARNNRDKKQRRFMHSGEKFQSGDQIRLLIDWKQGGFAFVLHRDAKGTFTPLYPGDQRQRGLFLPRQKGLHELAGSLKVTDSQHDTEEIWACFSHKPIDYNAVRVEIQKHIRHRSSAQSLSTCTTLQLFVMDRTGDKR